MALRVGRASIARVEPDGMLLLRHVIDEPELAALPWELLYNKALGRFLALAGHIPVARFVRQPIARPASVSHRRFAGHGVDDELIFCERRGKAELAEAGMLSQLQGGDEPRLAAAELA